MSVVLWIVTRSPYTLAFAALGPVVAVASVIDARRGARRRLRSEAARFAAELEAARSEVSAAHDAELRRGEDAAPSVHALLLGPQHERWGGAAPDRLRLGRADQPSAVSLDGDSGRRGEDAFLLALRDLRAQAAVLRAAPVTAPIAPGVGVVGTGPVARALARALVVQVLAFRSPATTTVRGGEDWLDLGPHERTPGAADRVEVSDGSTTVTIATAREAPALPAHLSTIIHIEGSLARQSHEPALFAPEAVSAEEAARWAVAARCVAERSGALPAHAALPRFVDFAELPAGSTTGHSAGLGAGLGTGPSTGLGAAIGADAAGPVAVDLVADGPHAVIGGTTGSGKSELLITWLLSIARSRSPELVNFLLFDFKGGSSFGALTGLPHCVGVVTDLDHAGAQRAIASLSAELRYRERVLAEVSARSIEQVPNLPRLLIVVDEFAAMATEFPELHGLFADLAARGRSLGVHLVLCTQRPSGVVRDAVLANASLRMSLRVNNRGDSAAVIGTDAAAAPTSPSGRAWIARGGHDPQVVQVAIASAADVAAVAERWGTDWHPRRPWLDPVPPVLVAVPGQLGLVDRPEQQEHVPLEWNPQRDGNLLVIGGAGSGKSNLLALVELDPIHGHGARRPRGLEEAWDALVRPGPLLLIDDVDLLIAQYSGEYQQAFVDLLVTALRSPASRTVLTAQRLTASIQQLAALCDSRILLRMPSRHEHVIAGGSGDDFAQDLPPGGGIWRGARMQLALAPSVQTELAPHAKPLEVRGAALAVSTRPRALSARLAESGLELAVDAGAATGVFVTDPEGWLAAGPRLGALLRDRPLLVHECSPLEYRQITRRRGLPPPIADPASTGWLLEPEAEPVRVRI
jgi:S-DNA-T family DNA segregation ATPase FtsK/SpoIIIE